MEGLKCCELLGPAQTHTILVQKVDRCKFNFDPTRTSKTHPDDHYRAHIPISAFSNHSSYLYDDRLEGLRCYMKWLNQSKHAPSWCGM